MGKPAVAGLVGIAYGELAYLYAAYGGRLLHAAPPHVYEIAYEGKHIFAVFGRGDAAPVPYQKRKAHLILQRRHHTAYSGGGIAEALRRGGK